MANIDNKKYIITDKERDVRRVARLHDRPNNNGSYGKAGLGPNDVKEAFDAAVDLVVEKHNNFVEDVSLQVNEHSLLIGNPSDTGVGDENVYQVLNKTKQLRDETKDMADSASKDSNTATQSADNAKTSEEAAQKSAEDAEQALRVMYGESGIVNEALQAILAIQQAYINGIMPANRVYPVGAIYMSVDPTSPSALFGGTWESLKDRFLLGAGDTYSAGTTGGSADAVVVAHQHLVDMRGGIGSSEITSGYNAILQTGLVKNNSIYTQTSGQNGTGKNMPPYLAVYMWKRIA
jgi:hypothetical protein